MIRIEVEIVEIVAPACHYNIATQSSGKPGLVIHPFAMPSEIRNGELRGANLAEKAVRDVGVVLKFLHSDAGKTAGLYRRPYPFEVCLVEILCE
jgi:hypothetical protein